MQKWECIRWYWSYNSDDSSHGEFKNITAMLNHYGEQGYELTSVVPDIVSSDITNGLGQYMGSKSYNAGEIFYFKRLKE